MTNLGSGLVQLYHGAQGVLAHVVVNLDVLTLEYQVAVQLHLLTGDTRTLCNSFLGSLSVDGQRLHSLQVLALVGDGSVEDALSQTNEVGTVSYEVGLALQGDSGCKAVDSLNEYATI